MDYKTVVVVGCGGIGSHLVENLARFLQFSAGTLPDGFVLRLVDKDDFAPHNMERQRCTWDDIHLCKAEVLAKQLTDKFPAFTIEAVNSYVTDENVADIIPDNSIVMSGVDNHSSRLTLAKHAETLKDVVLISGGNELHDGNVDVFVKKDGKKLTANIHEWHPEIANPTDKNPDELGCADAMEQQGAFQLVFMNATIATIMNNIFYGVVSGKWFELDQRYGEVKCDIVLGKTVTFERETLEAEVTA